MWLLAVAEQCFGVAGELVTEQSEHFGFGDFAEPGRVGGPPLRGGELSGIDEFGIEQVTGLDSWQLLMVQVAGVGVGGFYSGGVAAFVKDLLAAGASGMTW